ncbi:MAG: hypothetical protein CML13_06930 [Puniceicoccaceae bacterium]|nr:hypothetical protein [Puniceicoccaceae bacterium]|tara:strand:+ start:14185 stop:15765 length:1581 start_codon:yes stop_codon:yes gene_type:complete
MVRVNTVLVNPDETDAFVTEIHVNVVKNPSNRVEFSGPPRFNTNVREQIVSTLLPLVDGVLLELKVPLASYELSVVNPGIASSLDAAIRISGFSADLPLTLALLGAALDIPIHGSVFATGHIASSEGAVRAVRGLEAKAKAVMRLNRKDALLLYPHPDSSLCVSEEASPDLRDTRGKIRTHAISHLAQAIPHVFSKVDLILAALRQGYFSRNTDSRIATQLKIGTTEEFYNALENSLDLQEANHVQLLLEAWVAFHVKKRRYPADTGSRLYALLLSMPKAVRNLQTEFPLVPRKQIMRLASLAGESDYEDFELLGRANEGKVRLSATIKKHVLNKTDACSEVTLDVILNELSEQNLYLKIYAPLDLAFSRHQLCEGHSFDESILSFYLHLLRSIGEVTSATHKQIAPDAYALLERTYRNLGGSSAAIIEAKQYGIGGVRKVLERMFQTIRTERTENYIHYVFAQAIDPLDYSAKLELTKTFIHRFQHALPETVTAEPPERFAQKWDVLIRHWIDTQSYLRSRLHSL